MRFFITILASLTLLSCSDAMEVYHDAIEDLGYIAYSTPMKYSGTGTLVGGNAERLVVASGPDTCFSKEITGLRYVDLTDFPKKYREIEVGAEFTSDFIKILGAGSPPIEAGVKFSHVKSMDVEFKGASYEMMDTIMLYQYYATKLDPMCKKMLQRFGMIVSAIRVDGMEIKFYSENRVALEFSTQAEVSQVIKFGVGVSWGMKDKSTLIITSPKYIGYRIARMQSEDDGMAMYRASRLRMGKFKFEYVGLFDPGVEMDFSGQRIDSKIPPLEY